MTPKEHYETRKAERQKLKDMEFDLRSKTESFMMLDMMDRFVTAAERIADAMEKANLVGTSRSNLNVRHTTEPGF